MLRAAVLCCNELRAARPSVLGLCTRQRQLGSPSSQFAVIDLHCQCHVFAFLYLWTRGVKACWLCAWNILRYECGKKRSGASNAQCVAKEYLLEDVKPSPLYVRSYAGFSNCVAAIMLIKGKGLRLRVCRSLRRLYWASYYDNIDKNLFSTKIRVFQIFISMINFRTLRSHLGACGSVVV